MRNLQEQVKKHSVTKNCSDISLFEQIVLLISRFLQILGLRFRISKVFLTVGQNNFENESLILVIPKTYFSSEKWWLFWHLTQLIIIAKLAIIFATTLFHIFCFLGAARNLKLLRNQMEKRFSIKGKRAIRIEKAKYTKHQGITSNGCSLANYVIRR